MTIFIQPATYTCNQRHLNAEEVLKVYLLDRGSFKVVFDSIRGASGIFIEQEVETHVPFENLVGVPDTIKFSPLKLARFLEETYVKLVRSEDNNCYVVINQRIRGGGNKHSSHSQSYHNTSPPPPLSTHVNYSAGFPIRSLQVVPQLTGAYINSQGAAGGTSFSVTFQSHNAAERPDVIIHVWKKDYFAAHISGLQATKTGYIKSQSAISEQKQALEATQNAIYKMLESLRDHKASALSNSQGQLQLSNEMGVIESELKTHRLSLDQLLQQIHDKSPNIRNLIDLLPLINQLGINIINQKHVAIHEFYARDVSKDTLIGQDSNPSSLMGMTVVSLNKILKQCSEAHGKEIVALVGNTGAGKSTAINHLLGLPMQFRRDNKGGVVTVADGHQAIATIGHHPAVSQTVYTEICQKDPVPFVFADCGGFFDTRGTSTDIAVVTSLKCVLEKAKSVKLVLCCDSAILNSDRGILFHETIRLALKALLKNYKNHSGSVLLLLTKPVIEADNLLFDSQKAYQSISQLIHDLPDGSDQKELYQFLLRENGKYIAVCNPLSEENKGQLYHILNHMTPIQKSDETYQVACSTESQAALLEEMTETAIKANELYRKHAALLTKIDELLLTYAEINAKLSGYQKQIENSKRQITSAEEFLKENNLVNVRNSMKALDEQNTLLQQQIESCDIQIAQKDTTEIVVYRSTGGAWTVTDQITGTAL